MYFQGQVDARSSYSARVAVGVTLRDLANDPATSELADGAMFIASPLEHIDGRLELSPRMPSCNCTQRHGQVTDASRGTCLYCRAAGVGSVLVADRVLFNPYATDLPASRFALHVRGDLPGSNRIYDIFKAGAIPIVVSKDVEVTLPFPDVIPWRHIMFRVPEGPAEAQRTALLAALRAPQADLQRRLELMRLHAPDILWDVEGSRVFTSILVFAARHCFAIDIKHSTELPGIHHRPKWRHLKRGT